MILEPQTSFVLIEQSTGYVKAINGGRGQKTANRTLNRATDSLRQTRIDLQGHFLLCPGIGCLRRDPINRLL
ncbi:MAG: hypothetical protein ACLTR6_10115 [Clostridium fessum]